MNNKFFTMDNTEGYTQDQLNVYNETFPAWAKEYDFDLADDQELKAAADLFHNEVIIHGLFMIHGL
jgi:hypothetical protein